MCRRIGTLSCSAPSDENRDTFLARESVHSGDEAGVRQVMDHGQPHDTAAHAGENRGRQPAYPQKTAIGGDREQARRRQHDARAGDPVGQMPGHSRKDSQPDAAQTCRDKNGAGRVNQNCTMTPVRTCHSGAPVLLW